MYLIAGGSGFLGLNLAQSIVDHGGEVVITSRQRSNPMVQAVVDGAGGKIIVEMVDLNNPHEVYNLFSRYNFRAVAHTATKHLLLRQRSSVFTSYNMLFNTLEAATAFGVPRFVLASSFVVYRGQPGPWHEDLAFPPDATANLGVLLKSVQAFEVSFKRALEMIALDYGVPIPPWDPREAPGKERPQLETAVVRLPGQIGPRYYTMFHTTARLAHALAKGDSDGSLLTNRQFHPINEIAYVRDTSDGLRTVLQAPTLPHRIYNVSSGVHVTARDIVEAAQRVAPEAAARLKLDPAAQPVGQTTEFLDLTRMKQDFGWTPKFGTIDLVLGDYVKWLKSNPR